MRWLGWLLAGLVGFGLADVVKSHLLTISDAPPLAWLIGLFLLWLLVRTVWAGIQGYRRPNAK